MGTIEKIFTALGTVNHICVPFDGGDREPIRQALASAEKYITNMDDRLSVFKPESEISQINAHAGIRDTLVGRDTFDLLELCVRCGELTGGAFDVTTKPLTDAAFTGAAVNYRDILLDRRKLSVRLRLRGQGIHLGGIAKGYAVDRTAELLERRGVKNAVINLGGTVRNIGSRRRVGIRNPFAPAQTLLSFDSAGEAVATSGLYERGHHIFDPRSCQPADSDLLSVTAVGADGATADAAATACMVVGFRQGVELLRQLNLEGIFILKDGGVFATEAIQSRIIGKSTGTINEKGA